MISVVIPAYNEEKYIGKCLNFLVKQKTKQKFEVIVVNNNSTDSTGREIKKYLGNLNLKIVFEKNKGRGTARKAGFKKAKGDLIFSTDADTIVPENWLDKMATYFKDKKVIAVTGTCKINDCSKATNALFNFCQPKTMVLYRIIFKHYWLSGFNFAIRKSAYIKSGGFNSKVNALEDIELGFRVKKLGKIVFVNNLPVLFSGRRFRSGIIKGSLSYIKNFINYFLLKKQNMVLKDVR